MSLSKIVQESVESQLVGKNVHSVYVHCISCGTWGVNMPLEKTCGNCSKDTDTYVYYDSETIRNFLISSQIKLLEAELDRKKGMMKPTLTKPAREGIIGTMSINNEYNKAIQEDITYLTEQIEKCKELLK